MLPSLLMFPPFESRPKQLSLGPLETEILEILWHFGAATVKEVHEQILSDPDRELAYGSVTTVLQRLAHKGWVKSDRRDRAFRWQPTVSREEAQVLQSHHQLEKFLAVSNPDVVAAFVDRLDAASLDRLEAIAQRIQVLRQAREEE